ncbi:FAD-binding domain-containing protein, partial [Apiospora kogelbergensis]
CSQYQCLSRNDTQPCSLQHQQQPTSISAMADSSTTTRDAVIASLEEAGLGATLILPTKPIYKMRIDSYWSLGARLQPWAIAQPRTTDEVSRTVKAIVAVPGAQFAIRSGGHMFWPGASNITEGVTIDLGRLKKTTYDPATKLASVQPGARWNDVYPVVEREGVMVTGGRVGDVGVGGYLTGGGLSFHNCRTGLACDSVVRYEVVLGDGRVVEAERDNEHADLFRALKGAGNNLGIVTRFDLETFPAKTCWGGFAMYSDEAGPALLNAYGDYMRHVSEAPDGAYMLFWTYDSARMEVSWMTVLMGLDGDENAKMYEKTLEVPSNFAQMGPTSIYKIASSIKVPNGRYTAWRTLCYKYDDRVIQKTHERSTQLTQTIRDLGSPDKFSLGYVLQPVLKNMATQSQARGLDTVGLGAMSHDSAMFMIMAEFDTPELRDAAAPHIKAAFDDIEAFAAGLGASTSWLYINYCDPAQNPLATYGKEALDRLKEVSAKYDPDGVFQERVPGGFKISRV